MADLETVLRTQALHETVHTLQLKGAPTNWLSNPLATERALSGELPRVSL